jgi:GAF domain-containing protein
MANVPDQLARSLAMLADPAVARWSTRKKLLRVVELAIGTIGFCDAAGVALIGRRGMDGEVCTDEAAYRLDRAQFERGGGPCLDAVTSLQIFNVDEIARAPAWPAFRRAAAENGIRSSLSVPLTIGGFAIGRLNLYSRRLDGFEGCERSAATFAAGVAAALGPDTSESTDGC